jgi:hypothetical protein
MLAALAFMKQFLFDILRQLTGSNFRSGRLRLTRFAYTQMRELHLDLATVEDVFRHGRKVESLVKNYGSYSVSVSYRWDGNKNRYVITSCRKYENTRERR